jgi:hypothetical protein
MFRFALFSFWDRREQEKPTSREEDLKDKMTSSPPISSSLLVLELLKYRFLSTSLPLISRLC